MKNQTIFFSNPVYLNETATVAGPKESEGPLKKYFHHCLTDDLLGQKSHEHAEIKIHTAAINHLMKRANLSKEQVNCCFSGDLLDEIISSNFTMREIDVPFLGLYNACATLGEAYIVASSMISTGLIDNAICSVSSHFATAERQYRYPLELGSQRTPLSQWTVTAGAASLLSQDVSPIKIVCGTVGKVTDYGVKDANDMGGVMAPAALSTLLAHLSATEKKVDDYDLILTGDLGHSGSNLLRKLAEKEGILLKDNYTDCGVLIYNKESQNVEQGGSGACCCGLVFNSYIYKNMLRGRYKRVLLMPTGALLSKTSSLQGESIPAICHAVEFEVE
ncbi:MAG: stage V sporulation protein AD [Clostridia bacterium]|nr:stage V sporulation protein AD [Clostridia bacterium]